MSRLIRRRVFVVATGLAVAGQLLFAAVAAACTNGGGFPTPFGPGGGLPWF